VSLSLARLSIAGLSKPDLLRAAWIMTDCSSTGYPAVDSS
jgi:hypothetical protein